MNWGRLYVGSIVVAVGVILLLDNLGTADAGEIFSTWWPILVIVGGLLMWLANPRHWAPPLIVTAVGVGLLLSSLDVVDIGNVLWPAILVVVGLAIIFGLGTRGRAADAGNSVSSFTIFSGRKLVSRSQSFTGGSLSALFGGVEVDLSDAELAPGAVIDVFAAFGAAEITVPTDWQVDVRGFPVFGGIDDATTRSGPDETAPTLVVNATVLFGGLEIRN